MNVRNGFRRQSVVAFALAASMALGTVAYGQPFQNPFDNPFDTPEPRPTQPAPTTPPAESLPPELPGLRRPVPAPQPRPGLPAQPQPPDQDAMEDDPFRDDPVQPTDPETPSVPYSSTPAELAEGDGTVDPELRGRINDLLNAERFAEAIPLIESIIKQLPAEIDEADPYQAIAERYELFTVLGVANRMIDRYDEAIKAFGEAARYALVPAQESEAHLRRGIAWLYKGEPRIAVREFEAAESAAAGGNDPRPEFWKGLVLAQQGRHREAITAYSNSLRAFGGYTLARNNRGLAYLQTGEINFAIADFDEVIRQAPDDASAYYKRGIALGRRGDFREAIASYSEAIRLDPKLAPSYYNRGLLHRQLGNTQQAEADLSRARQLNPQIGALSRPTRVARR